MTGFAALPLSEQPDSGSQWAGVAKILGPRWAQLPSLTVGLVGVQLMWSVEMSYAMPYLISLGMSKSVTAIVFLAGPISGLVVQPFIGTVADNSKSRFGRRRPYILAGVAVCASAILLLGFTRQFASIVTTTGSSANNSLTIFLAVWAIFCIDFGINAVQAVDRALLVDTLPPPDQPSGNAWAARMLGIGSVAGFFIGNVDMTRVLPFLGNTELQILSAFSSIVLVGTHTVTAYLVKERVLLASSQAKKSLKQELKELWDCARSLPHVIRQICMIQFFAWLGWFPILFDTTLYVGDLYRRSVSANTTISQEDIDSEATRLGARAQFYSALVALATNFLAPMIIAEVKPRSRRRSSMGGLALGGGIEGKRWWQRKLHLATLWAASHALFAICMVGTFFTSNVTGATVLITLTGFSWAITQWAPFSLLAEAILTTPSEDDPDTGDIRSILLTDSRTHLPLDEDDRRDREPSERDQFLIGHDDDDRSDVGSEQSDMVFEAGAIRLGSVKKSRAANGGGLNGHNGHGDDHEHDDWSEVDAEGAEREGDYHEGEEDTSREGLMGNSAARQSFVDVGGAEDVHSHPPRNRVALDGEQRAVETSSALSGKAGIILGIHNIFIVIPQFLITGLSSLIFALLDPSKSVLHAHIPPPSSNTTTDATDVATRFVWRQDDGLEDVGGEEATTEGPNAVAIIFRIGGLAAAAAFIISWRLARELRRR